MAGSALEKVATICLDELGSRWPTRGEKVSPGVAGHSEATPTLPMPMPDDPNDPANKGALDKQNCLMHGICTPEIQKEIDLENAEMKWKGDKAAGLPVGPEPMPPDTGKGGMLKVRHW